VQQRVHVPALQRGRTSTGRRSVGCADSPQRDSQPGRHENAGGGEVSTGPRPDSPSTPISEVTIESSGSLTLCDHETLRSRNRKISERERFARIIENELLLAPTNGQLR
jgi:hypothetical protein